MAPVVHWISTPKWSRHRPFVYISHLLYLLSKTWHQWYLSPFGISVISKYRHSHLVAPVVLPLQTFAQPPVWQASLCPRSAQYSLFVSTFSLSLVVFKELFLWLTMQVSFAVQQAGSPSSYCQLLQLYSKRHSVTALVSEYTEIFLLERVQQDNFITVYRMIICVCVLLF